MQKWEYTNAMMVLEGTNYENIAFKVMWGEKGYEKQSDLLNDLGSQGWELISTMPVNAPFQIEGCAGLVFTTTIFFYFKRPME